MATYKNQATICQNHTKDLSRLSNKDGNLDHVIIHSAYCLVYNMDEYRICGNDEFNAIFLRLIRKLKILTKYQVGNLFRLISEFEVGDKFYVPL